MQYSDAFIDAALAGDAAFVFLCSKELDVQLDADIRTPSAVCWLAKSLLLSEPAIQLLLFMRSNHGDCCSASELANRPALLSLFDVLCSMENIDDRHIVKAMNKALTMSDKHLIFLSSGPRKLIREYVDSLSNRDDIKKGGRCCSALRPPSYPPCTELLNCQKHAVPAPNSCARLCPLLLPPPCVTQELEVCRRQCCARQCLVSRCQEGGEGEEWQIKRTVPPGSPSGRQVSLSRGERGTREANESRLAAYMYTYSTLQ